MVKVIKLVKTVGSSSISLAQGVYKFECWGAQGGTGLKQGAKVYSGGKGAYTSGIIILTTRTRFYLYVGGKGSDGSATKNTIASGGYNGGGNSGKDTNDDDGSGAGGGSSDIRLVGGTWNTKSSLVSRIMVAAGGSGSAFDAYGAPGGTIKGYKVTAELTESYAYSTTNQTKGYKLGVGESGRDHTNIPSSGAGGGYYGGYAGIGIADPSYQAVSSSGSSFISGYTGCKAVNKDGVNINSAIHYSKLEFINPIMNSGIETFFSPSNINEKGHSGNGAIKITYLYSARSCRYKYRKSRFIQSQVLIIINK